MLQLLPGPQPDRQRRWSAFGFAWLLCGLCVSAQAIAGNHSTMVTVTAYNGVAAQTDKHPRLGAWGSRLGPKTVAVSPDLIERGLDDGAKVAIEGYKHDFVVRDKTSDDLHNTVDIYMRKDLGKARNFGKKRLRIWWHTPNG